MATVSDLALLLVAGLAIYLHMQGTGGRLTTLVEYSLNGDGNKDFYDVSLVAASTLLSPSILQMASAPPLHAKPT
ncbi:hypothetical protein SUGI_0860530 [Cryptomeria japonica]|nr:hypothetical protein SUGI_0860530 [Cryptomeria japonica]